MLKSKKFATLSFVITVTLLSIIFYRSTITEFPRAIHAWTQSDRYAIALKFLENGFDFFHPATYNLKGKEGVTQVDFPVNEYLVAIAMKISGSTEPVVFRMYTLLYCIIGLFFLFKLTHSVTNNYFYSLLVVVFVFTLPVYCYNQAGFIPSAPAFSSMLIGVYFLYRYYQTKNQKDHFLVIVFMTLAALSRLPFVIFLFALLGSTALLKLREKAAFVKSILPCIGGIAMVGLYYLYNKHLADEYGAYFLMEPQYISSWEMFNYILKAIKERWITEYLTVFHYVIFAIAAGFAVIKRKDLAIYVREQSLFSGWLIFSLFGAVAYFFINGVQYIDHDYYFIDSFMLPLIILLVLLFRFISFNKNIIQYGFSVALVFLLSGAAYNCYSSQQQRFSVQAYDQVEQARQSFIGSGEFLDSLGVPRDAKLLVLQAYTSNTPFIYMKRNGYTVLVLRNGDFHQEVMEKEFDYVVMPSRFIVNEVLPYAPELFQQLSFYATNGKIVIYKKPKGYGRIKNKCSMEEFMGVDKKQVVYSTTLSAESPIEKIDSRWSNFTLPKQHTAWVSCAPPRFEIPSSQEYAATFSIPGDSLFAAPGNKLVLLRFQVVLEDNKNVIIVASADGEKGNLFYETFSLDKDHIRLSEWQNIYCGFVLPATIAGAKEFKVYFWNQGKTNFLLNDTELVICNY